MMVDPSFISIHKYNSFDLFDSYRIACLYKSQELVKDMSCPQIMFYHQNAT